MPDLLDVAAVIADDQLIDRIANGQDDDADDVARLLVGWAADVRR